MKDYRLSELLDMSLIQKLADSNFLATGLPMSIVDAFDTSILVRAGWTDICLKFHRANPLSNKRCLESDDELKDHLAEGGFYKYKCKNGLWHVAIPIIVAGSHLATMFLTQFYFEGEVPEREYFIRQANRFGYDTDQYLAALDRLPVFSEEKVNYILAYDKALVRFISDLAEQSMRVIESEEAIRRLNEELELRVIERAHKPESANIELKTAQSRILQQEKMASVGQLAAVLAHEINNPMGFIISNLSSLERYMNKIARFIHLQSEAVAKLAGQEETNRSEIVERIDERKKALKLDYIMDDLVHLIKEPLMARTGSRRSSRT